MAQSSTLRLQFPVSSGSQHRTKESEWVPVEKDMPSTAAGAPAGDPIADKEDKVFPDATASAVSNYTNEQTQQSAVSDWADLDGSRNLCQKTPVSRSRVH